MFYTVRFKFNAVATLSVFLLITDPVSSAAQPAEPSPLPPQVYGSVIGDLRNYALWMLLPISSVATSDMGRTQLTITDILYERGDQDSAVLLAVARPGSTVAPIQRLLRSSDRGIPIHNVANRLARRAGAGYVVIMRLKATWTPWKLVFEMRNGEFAIARTRGRVPSSLTTSLGDRTHPLKVYEIVTSNVLLHFDVGREMRVNLALAFVQDRIDFAIVPEISRTATPQPADDVSGRGGLAMEVPYAFVNHVLSTVYQDFEVNLQGNTQAIFQRVEKPGTDASLVRIIGRIVPTGMDSVLNAGADLLGPDLRLRDAAITDWQCNSMPTDQCLAQRLSLAVNLAFASNQHRNMQMRPSNVFEFPVGTVGTKTLLIQILKALPNNDHFSIRADVWMKERR